jgi:hypothetical protein
MTFQDSIVLWVDNIGAKQCFENKRNKLNVTLRSTHLQYNAQQEKKIGIFFIVPAQ